MRIVLLYPPPWKIPAPGQSADASDGPPPGFQDRDIDADFLQMPYGLLSLAAQARRAGHEVKVFNLSTFPWSRVERVVAELDAELYGLTSFTANRRGVGLVAGCIRRHHPAAHIVVGGPHVTALPLETLRHYRTIDTVVIGEGEVTFLELVDRLAAGRSSDGLAGAASRAGQEVALGPGRARIDDLDELASPHDHFDTHLLLTSRGCPGRCTFCATRVVWGRALRAQSAGTVLSTLETALARLPVKMVTIKDETFTANRKRGLAICRGIRERGLDVVWSCDTRADALDEELLREMRLAGCQRLSLGVESGSPAVLRRIGKRVTPETVQKTTRLAKRVGLQVRYFMMLGNRGETAATFQESLDFLAAAQPHQYLFACLSIYPGTEDFAELERAGVLEPDVYFTERFQELKEPFDASVEDTQILAAWFERNVGLHDAYREGVDEYRAILERLGDYHAAHLDLGGAYYHAGEPQLAEQHIRRALELGYPLPGLALNYLACLGASRRDFAAMQEHLAQALRDDPLHPVLVHNAQLVRRWLEGGGPASGSAPKLAARHDFQLLERPLQPILPGPLPADYAAWDC